MPNPHPRFDPTPWTEALDQRLIRLRREGVSWGLAAAILKRPLSSTLQRGRHLAPQIHHPAITAPAPNPIDDQRHPLPPGHPDTWLPLLTDPTGPHPLYPFPVFV